MHGPATDSSRSRPDPEDNRPSSQRGPEEIVDKWMAVQSHRDIREDDFIISRITNRMLASPRARSLLASGEEKRRRGRKTRKVRSESLVLALSVFFRRELITLEDCFPLSRYTRDVYLCFSCATPGRSYIRGVLTDSSGSRRYYPRRAISR